MTKSEHWLIKNTNFGSDKKEMPAGTENASVTDCDNNGYFCRKPDLGIFIPECNQEDGAFLVEQCNITAGVCWCVDEKGHEKRNTRARVQPGTRDCKAVIIKSTEQSKGVFLFVRVSGQVKLAKLKNFLQHS